MSTWSKLALFVAVATALSSPAAGHRHGPGTKARHFGRAPTSNKSVIIEMFEWNWDSVAAECQNFIGPAGYGFVQGTLIKPQPRPGLWHSLESSDSPTVRAVNPPQESIGGDQWWTDYQAVSYQLTSKHGNRQQFQNMVNACHSAGVGVIVGE